MIIRKRYRVESGHTVRNATSYRCSHSYHGHSAVIDVFLDGRKLDNAQMLVDFGLLKGVVGKFIDSMDHTMILCDRDDPKYTNFFKEVNDRYIILPFNPTAEMLSIFIMHYVNRILDNTQFNNGEDRVRCVNVEYNETATGMARCDYLDEQLNWVPEWEDQIVFSEGVKRDWSKELKDFIETGKYIINPTIPQQINLSQGE